MTPPTPTGKADSRWLQLQLWGLDTPITALCWAIACSALMQITMITAGPLLLVAGGVWCMVMLQRLYSAIVLQNGWQAGFYREHLPVILLLLFAVGMATLWMSFFYVGQTLFHYAILPGFLFALSRVLPRQWFAQVSLLLQAIAFAMFCCIPAFYFSFTLSPLHMLTTGPVWYLGMLFFLMARERERLRNQNYEPQEMVVTTLTLILLLGRKYSFSAGVRDYYNNEVAFKSELMTVEGEATILPLQNMQVGKASSAKVIWDKPIDLTYKRLCNLYQLNKSTLEWDNIATIEDPSSTWANNYVEFYQSLDDQEYYRIVCQLYQGEYLIYEGELFYGTNPATSIENMDSAAGNPSPVTHKLLRNGQLLIERDGKTYNAQGAEMR